MRKKKRFLTAVLAAGAILLAASVNADSGLNQNMEETALEDENMEWEADEALQQDVTDESPVDLSEDEKTAGQQDGRNNSLTE